MVVASRGNFLTANVSFIYHFTVYEKVFGLSLHTHTSLANSLALMTNTMNTAQNRSSYAIYYDVNQLQRIYQHINAAAYNMVLVFGFLFANFTRRLTVRYCLARNPNPIIICYLNDVSSDTKHLIRTFSGSQPHKTTSEPHNYTFNINLSSYEFFMLLLLKIISTISSLKLVQRHDSQ